MKNCYILNKRKNTILFRGKQNMEREFVEFPVSRSDRFVNHFVKLALLMRGSGKLFSSAKAASEYLQKGSGKSRSLELCGRYPCRAFQKTLCGLECAVFEPFGEECEARVLFFHGGAYVRRMTEHHIKTLAALCAKSGAQIIAPCYPTAPEYNFSQSIEALAKLYESVCAEKKGIVLSGDSCGAAIAVCLSGEIAKRGLPECKKLLLFSPLLSHDICNAETAELAAVDPMFCGTEGLKLFIDVWSAGNDLAEPFKTDVRLLAPTYIFTSSCDMLSVGCRRFFEKAAAAGAKITAESYEGMFHDYFLYPLSCSKELLKKSAALIREE